MAFLGHINTSGEIVRSEMYNGLTQSWTQSSCSEEEKLEGLSACNGSPRSTRTYSVPSEMSTVRCSSTSMRGSSSEDSFRDIPETYPSSGEVSNNSSCSWTEMYMNQGRENPVPSLDLSSGSLSGSNAVRSFKTCSRRLISFRSWYSDKQKERQEQLQRAKEALKLKQQSDEERKLQAETSYKAWCEKKALQAAKQRHSNVMIKEQSKNQRRNIPPEIIQNSIRDWYLKKCMKEDRQREADRHYKMYQLEQEKIRKELAQLAWKKWISNVNVKPKPVPLNQGMDSLRGTISEQYMNPEPWRKIID